MIRSRKEAVVYPSHRNLIVLHFIDSYDDNELEGNAKACCKSSNLYAHKATTDEPQRNKIRFDS
eukprot:891151-Amphidinium_carterae.2